MIPENIFAPVAASSPEEHVEVLWSSENLRIEKIVSRGHATPPNQWYDQDADEWVLLLAGSARLQIEGYADLIALRPGDFLLLPAHQRHRVDWTDPNQATIWLAVHALRAE